MKVEQLKLGDKFLHEGNTYEVGYIAVDDQFGEKSEYIFIAPPQECICLHKDTEIELTD